MKKLLFISMAVLLSFGFTFKGDSKTEITSECTYLNKIHSSINSDETLTCPYLKGKIFKEGKSISGKENCPYSDEAKGKSSECPYLKNKDKIESSDVKPVKIIKLKTS